MLIFVILASIVTTYFLVNLTAVYTRNQKAFKFFTEKCPHLPTVKDPSIFGGHLLSIVMNQNSWKIITDLHEKYGPTFGLFYVEMPWIATKDLDLIKLIEIDEAKKHTNRAFFGGPLKHINNSIFQIDDEDWRATRHVVAPALTNYVVRGEGVTADIELVVGKLAASIRRKLEKNMKLGKNSLELEVRDAFERLALGVIFLVSYKKADMIDFDGDQDRWTQVFKKGARDGGSPLVLLSIMFPFSRGLIGFLARFSPFGIWEKSIVEHIEESIRKRQIATQDRNIPGDANERNETSSTGVLSSMVKTKGTLLDTVIEGYATKKIKYDHFMGSLLFLVMAGAVTTADTLSCLIWQLAKNPDIQERLRKSLDEDGINSEYLMWCINETIRWHPAVPIGTGRVLGEDVEVNGQHLPKGAFVMPSAHSIHHDPKIWPDPERFHPDRWRDQANFHPAQFVGFGLGPRNCVGRYLAVHEIKLTVKMLLAEYKIETCDRTPREWRFKVPAMLYTVMEKPLIVKFTPLTSY